jgi:16S rRNA (adenine1518-N6/adenine1519-N6)-dimethyltransferase
MQEFLKFVNLNGKKVANKNLGQNFLKNENIINKIIESSGINKDTQVIEIGPGLGSLTFRILHKTSNFIGIEKDGELFQYLKQQFDIGTFLHADAMNFDFQSIINHNTIIISNLPYNIGTKLIIKLGIEVLSSIKSMTIMLQKDVVMKILGKPQNENYHQLGVFFQSFCTIEHICDVPSSAFAPAPNVLSAVVKITPKNHDINLLEFWNFLQKTFCFKRKIMGSIFPNLDKDSIITNKRPEDISITEFIDIFRKLHNTF